VGLSLIGVSSAFSAVITWVVLLVAARTLGPDRFADFLVVWGLFFGITGVLAGLQQEVTRSASRVSSSIRRAPLLHGVAIVALVGVVAILVTAPLWAADVFGRQHIAGAVVLAGAFAGYSAANLVNGVLGSRGAWNTYALLILAEGVLRAVATLTVVQMSVGPAAWAVAISTGLVAWMLIGPFSNSARSVWSATGDVSVRRFLRHGAQALAASACSAAMIAGFAPLVRLLGAGDSGAAAGIVFATVLVTRAPVLILLTAFQGPIIRHLTTGDRPAVRWVIRTLSWGAAATAVGSAIAYVAGPAFLRLVFGRSFEPGRQFAAVAVTSVGLLAALTIVGWLMLALRRHSVFLAGWTVAMGFTVACLALDVRLETRTSLALIAGPAAGLLTYGAAAGVRRRAFGGPD
jgi:O-antigen/teichoic acid export membrane protein